MTKEAPKFRPLNGVIYQASEGFEQELLKEIGSAKQLAPLLYLAPASETPVYWAQNIWFNPVEIDITSIKDAAKQLRSLQRNWWHVPSQNHGRAKLITKQLPHISAKPIQFKSLPPESPLGAWTLIESDKIIAATEMLNNFPNGEVNFIEDKKNPPSRAYLKLWEAFTRIRQFPEKGQRTMDLGACPGGWSWVLHDCGANVIAVDKAPLAPNVNRLPRLAFKKESAFGLEPKEFGQVDWLCSDIIAYPPRLLNLIKRWISEGSVRNFIITLKFQGEVDMDIVRQFAEIENSQIIHLFHNKHELTWIKLAD